MALVEQEESTKTIPAKNMDFQDWLQEQPDKFHKNALLNIRNELAGKLWIKHGCQRDNNPVKDIEDAQRLLIKAYVQNDKKSLEEIVDLWNIKNGHH